MKVLTSVLDPAVIDCLKNGGVVVARTDTIYGILARADDETAVKRVFDIKGRADTKSPIVLISSYQQMFDQLPQAAYQFSIQNWPAPITIATPCHQAPWWLKRGNDEFGYRMPAVDDLRSLIEKVGPLIAPSANPEGVTPAMSIEQAIDYFSTKVDIYVDGGTVTDNTPSQLIRVKDDGSLERLR
jgi:L-threonylcarbamoyladenylate synthase